MTLPANTGFPTNIPDPFGQTPNGKVTYTGLKSTRYRFNMGAGFALYVDPAAAPRCMEIARARGYSPTLAGSIHKEGGRKAVEIGPLGIAYEADTLRLR